MWERNKAQSRSRIKPELPLAPEQRGHGEPSSSTIEVGSTEGEGKEESRQ